MKKLLFLVLIFAVFLFYPAKPNSSIHKIQEGIKSIGKSNTSYNNDLVRKQAELEAYEKAIVDLGNKYESLRANAPICPTTGERASINITKDPREDLRVKCEVLREEIIELESKI